LDILDKDGDIIYTIRFRSVLLKSQSELRLAYQVQDIAEQTFSLTFKFNFLDIYWMLDDQSPIREQSISDTEVWTHENDVLPTQRPQNLYNIDN
jgi:hypothetical protein